VSGGGETQDEGERAPQGMEDARGAKGKAQEPWLPWIEALQSLGQDRAVHCVL
jgi:hypothetical protein